MKRKCDISLGSEQSEINRNKASLHLILLKYLQIYSQHLIPIQSNIVLIRKNLSMHGLGAVLHDKLHCILFRNGTKDVQRGSVKLFSVRLLRYSKKKKKC